MANQYLNTSPAGSQEAPFPRQLATANPPPPPFPRQLTTEAKGLPMSEEERNFLLEKERIRRGLPAAWLLNEQGISTDRMSLKEINDLLEQELAKPTFSEDYLKTIREQQALARQRTVSSPQRLTELIAGAATLTGQAFMRGEQTAEKEYQKQLKAGTNPFTAIQRSFVKQDFPSDAVPLFGTWKGEPISIPLPGGRSIGEIDIGVKGAIELAADPLNIPIARLLRIGSKFLSATRIGGKLLPKGPPSTGAIIDAVTPSGPPAAVSPTPTRPIQIKDNVVFQGPDGPLTGRVVAEGVIELNEVKQPYLTIQSATGETFLRPAGVVRPQVTPSPTPTTPITPTVSPDVTPPTKPAVQKVGLTPDEATELDRIKRLVVIQETEPLPSAVNKDLPSIAKPRLGQPGYRPPPARTAAQRADDIADAKDEVIGAKEDLAVEQKIVDDLIKELAQSGPETARLPKELAGAKPNYNIGMDRYIPQFDSDLDKALFIVSQAKKSRHDESYMVWLREQLPNFSDAELRAAGGDVRNHIKKTLVGKDEGDVVIPTSRVVSEAIPQQSRLTKEEIQSLREEISEAKESLQDAKSNLTEANSDLRLAKKPAGHTPEETAAIKEADRLDEELDTNHLAYLKSMKEQIDELETRKATVAPAPEAVEEVTPKLVSEPGQPPHLPPVRDVEEAIPPGSRPSTKTTPSGVQTSLDNATEIRNLDRPGVLGSFLESLAGIKRVLFYVREANNMPDEFIVAHIAQNSERAAWMSEMFKSRYFIFKQINELFGPKASTGAKTDVPFIGPSAQRTSETGTFFDIGQNPHLYDLTVPQRSLIASIDARNTELLYRLNKDFGTEIGEFTPKSGGMYLPNVDNSESVLELLDTTPIKQARRGRGKSRLFDSATDRKKNNPAFIPQTNIETLLSGMDEWKANVASSQVFNYGIGGLTRVELVDLLKPKLRKTRDNLANRVINLERRINTAMRQRKAALWQKQQVSNLAQKARQQAKPILDQIDNLGEQYGPELSYLSGQVREVLNLAVRAERKGKNFSIRAVEKRAKAVGLLTELNELTQELAKIRKRYDGVNLQGYELVDKPIYRYFPIDNAKIVKELQSHSENRAFRFLEEVRGTAFAGDLSPIAGVQLPWSVLFLPPKTTVMRLIGAGVESIKARDLLRTFRTDTMAKAFAEDPAGYRDLAFYSGMQISMGTPQEFMGGLLRYIPGFSKANEAMFAVVQRQMKAVYDDQLIVLAESNITGPMAKAIAADMATKVIPLWNPSRLGLSKARATALRSFPTSISFLTRPATLMAEATTGLGKLAAKQPLKPQEQLALRLMLRYTAATEILAITTAVGSALALGRDPWKAAERAVNPLSPQFGDVILGTRRLPVGGPYRGIMRAIVPRKVGWAPIPMPFAGVFNFFKNRITPALMTSIRLLLNRDFQGGTIREGQMPEQILRSALYVVEGFAPLTAAAAISGVRRGLNPSEIAEETTGQFFGTNMSRESPYTSRNFVVQKWAKQEGIPGIDTFYNLPRSQRKLFNEAHPEEVVAIKAETKRRADQGIPSSIAQQELENVTTDRIASEDALVRELESGVIELDVFRDTYGNIQAKAAHKRAAKNEAFNLFQEEQELPKDPNKRALVEYYNAYETARMDSTRFDFDILEQELQKLKAKWTSDQNAYVDRETKATITDHPPIIMEYLADREATQPYRDLVFDFFDKANVGDLYRDYLRSVDKKGFITQDKETETLIRRMLQMRTGIRKTYRMNNPDMERKLWKWGWIDEPIHPIVAAEVKLLRQRQGGVITNRRAIDAIMQEFQPVPAGVR